MILGLLAVSILNLSPPFRWRYGQDTILPVKDDSLCRSRSGLD